MDQNIFAFNDFRDILRHEFKSRYQRNSRYSLRAFARDLGISEPRLSDLLKGRNGLSQISAQKIANRLGMNQAQSDFFWLLVVSKNSRSLMKRENARLKLKKLRSQSKMKPLSDEVFKIVGSWYHMAILELTYTSGFKSDTKWIADKLGISEADATDAIARLREFGLLRLNHEGKLEATEDFSEIETNLPSPVIQNFHRQVLDKASKAIQGQSPEKRSLQSLLLAFSSSDILEAQEEIQDFTKRFCLKYGARRERDQVYALSIQLFNLISTT